MSQTKAQLLDGKSATIQFTGGSASAPSVSFTGDTNTGIYSPGADQIAISTGGSGRLFVDASGAISTSSTAWQGGAAYQSNGFQLGGTTYAKAVLQTGGTSRAEWFFDNADNYLQAKSGGFYIANTTANPIAFYTNGSEHLRITSAGLVGIGTSSPGSRLTVNRVNFADASATGATTLSNAGITVEAATDTNNRLMFGIGSTGGAPWIQAQNTSSNATQSLILNPVGGNVGIGTTSPVFGVGDGVEVARSGVATVRVSSNTQGVELRSDNGTGTLETRAAYPFLFGTSGTERARIDSSGRLLVGTSSASGVNSNTAPVLAGNFASFTDSVSANHNTATTLFTLENLNATYMVTAVITGTANAGAYHAVYIVGSVAANSHSIQALKAGSLLTLSLSGANVQATQGSGVAQTVTWSVTRMANL